MASKTEQYLHKVTTNRPCRWLDIGLHNLAASMSHTELEALLPKVQAAVLARWQADLTRLQSLEAPEVIMKTYTKLVERAKSGQHSHIAIVRRELAKR